MPYFSNFFTTYLRNSALIFRAFGGKAQIVGKCRENFLTFSKDFLRNLRKMHSFSIFFKRLNKPCVNFSRVWTKKHKLLWNWEKILKIFDENWTEKLHFLLFLENFLLKIWGSEITQFFYNNSFGFGGGWIPPPLNPPWIMNIIS